MSEDLTGGMIGATIHINNPQTRFLTGNKTDNFETVIHNVNRHFSVVGITDLFDESIFLMKKNLGWTNIDYRKLNISQNHSSNNEIPEHIRRLIENKNKIDVQLYHYFKQELRKNIAALDPQATRELQQFKARIQKL